MIPTTDQMDSTTPDDRWKLVAMCSDCGTWKHFTGGRHKMLQTNDLECDNCRGHSFNSRTLISERTFDAAKAKKETAALLRKKKK